jgi:hypothetical protein
MKLSKIHRIDQADERASRRAPRGVPDLQLVPMARERRPSFPHRSNGCNA